MLKKSLLFFMLLFFSNIVIAYELNGTMQDNGNGTYIVTLQSDDGDEYKGTGIYEGDGILKITVHGNNGVVYSGTATDYGDDEYHIDLQNYATGVLASGTINLEAEQP